MPRKLALTFGRSAPTYSEIGFSRWTHQPASRLLWGCILQPITTTEGGFMIASLKQVTVTGRIVTALTCIAALCMSAAHAQTLTSSQTGTHGGYYYSFWTDGGG